MAYSGNHFPFGQLPCRT